MKHVFAMNNFPLPVTLLALLLLTGCAGESHTLAERARDSRLAVLQPQILVPGALASTASATSTDNDNPVPPDCPEKKQCQDHNRHGDKACKCEHDDDRHDKGLH